MGLMLGKKKEMLLAQKREQMMDLMLGEKMDFL